jgi:murein DD-endopeptidase MepM/ murein hydrolase activator NlpD
MPGEPRRQQGLETPVQFVEPQCAADGIAGRFRKQRIQRRLRLRGALPAGRTPGQPGPLGREIRHRMTVHMNPPQGIPGRVRRLASRIAGECRIAVSRIVGICRARAAAHPVSAAIVIAAAGMGLASALHSTSTARMQAMIAQQEARLESTRREAQREVNALAARLGELQAQANRLNALGDRLTRVARLRDGEFDFNRPVGVGGAEASRDISAGELLEGMQEVQGDFRRSGMQLSVLEALLFDRELERNAMPSRAPVADSYVTSGYGGRADPFGGGRQFHRGIDFDARTGDPVMAVADGVVSYS